MERRSGSSFIAHGNYKPHINMQLALRQLFEIQMKTVKMVESNGHPTYTYRDYFDGLAIPGLLLLSASKCIPSISLWG